MRELTAVLLRSLKPPIFKNQKTLKPLRKMTRENCTETNNMCYSCLKARVPIFIFIISFSKARFSEKHF